jgi:Tat binding protein 1(TBP-1)-interacting protein (TBPIP).
MNRPYGAVDVSANLKGAVPKAATQKILLALADKGELVQKVYGEFDLHYAVFSYTNVTFRQNLFFCCESGEH